ncbi:MAG: diaminopimelate decarboxylase [Gammaproteobacteria bacterium]
MQMFAYSKGQLCAEDVSLADIANRFGTPCYVYSRAEIKQQWTAFDSAFGEQRHLICYAVKANSNLAILNLLARLGSGFDIVSVGELERVLKAGGEPGKVVFSGVGKREDEMRRALDVGIKCFNVESITELERLNSVATEMNVNAPVSLRVNPDVEADTHPYIATGLHENKFGIGFAEALSAYEMAAAMENIDIIGIDCHIGSQITAMAPIVDALNRLRSLITSIEDKGISLQHIDVGGGLGICYQDETPPTVEEYVHAVQKIFADTTYELILEPGRSIMGNAGVLLTRVEYLKSMPDKNFAVVDAAMNDLLRPALYNAWHEILLLNEQADDQGELYDVVGPVCETGDFLGKDRKLALQEGDILAVCSAGAYGFCMSSNYNSRPRVCEVMVDGDNVYEIRRRESADDLMAGEMLLPD